MVYHINITYTRTGLSKAENSYLTANNGGEHASTNFWCILKDKDLSQLPYIPIYIKK